MKSFIVLSILGLMPSVLAGHLQFNKEQQRMIDNIFTECLTQERISDKDANKLRKLDLSNPTENVKCFNACFLEKLGIFKDNKIMHDSPSIAKMESILGKENARPIFHNCKDIKGSNRCDTGYKFYKCFEKHQQ